MESDDLFSPDAGTDDPTGLGPGLNPVESGGESAILANQPLAARMRPRTLDEYIDRHRDPQRAASAAEAEPGRGKAGRVEAVEATPKAAAPVTKRRELPKLPVDERPGETREQRRNRKRDEARRRAERTKALGPLQKRVRELEVRIEQLESQQRERNLQLADPALYEDPKQRDALLAEYQRDGVELGELTDAWELAQAELEEAQAGLEG